MITDDVKKKLYVWMLVALAVIGALFVIWAIFLNKGLLEISAAAPYTVKISDIKQISCEENPCEIKVAPGNYSVTIEKQGYVSYSADVNVPIWGKAELKPALTYNAYLSEIEESAATPVFASEPDTAELKRNPDNGRQTLYYNNGIIAASFVRDLKNQLIFPAISTYDRIAVIDRPESGSTLYIVDLQNKSRDNYLSMPLIENVKWLSADNLIIQGRNTGDSYEKLFSFKLSTKKLTPLEVVTTLDNVDLIDENTLIAVTNQKLGSAAAQPEGQVVSFTSDTNSNPSFVYYSLVSNQGTLIKTVDKFKTAEKIKLTDDKKNLILKTDAGYFELTFRE